MFMGLRESLVSWMGPRMRVRAGMNLELLLISNGLTDRKAIWLGYTAFDMIIKVFHICIFTLI